MSDVLFVVALLVVFAGCLIVVRVLNLRDARSDGARTPDARADTPVVVQKWSG
ncbi:hypothetical protein [Mycolicibacterium baixiangningiae]|uniref:hypothetical protein n=1 Tax=Mycolicibacterium baixiangningiae TaxID=2761578 RepID=UPI0018D1B32F|nr:hypothetical protein [Mycolicibacterium baixiangningiae]